MKKCVYCGKEYPDAATLCEIDHYPLEETQPETAANGNKSPTAGFGIRFLARLIDFAFGILVGITAGLLGSMLIMVLCAVGFVAPGWQERIHGLSLAGLGLALVGNIAYHTFCEGIHGATLGKLCCGIRVMTEDMKPSKLKGGCSFALWHITLIHKSVAWLAAVRCRNLRSINAMAKWGKTMVVKIKELNTESKPSMERLLIGLLVGVGCYFVMLLLGLLLQVSYP